MNAYVVNAKRTPIGRSHADKGLFRNLRADVLLGQNLDALVTPEQKPLIEDVLIGCVGQHLEQGKNLARLSLLQAHFPETVAGVTINRLCGSSLQAFNFAAQALACEQNSIVIAGGVEHMHHVPMGAAVDYNSELLARYEFPFTQMGLTAERVAKLKGISRAEQDQFALLSHQKACRAQKEGFFEMELFSVQTPDGLAESDQGPRADTSLEALATLKTPFLEKGTVTAGNSSPLSDGASAALMANRDGLAKLGLKPRAQVLGTFTIGLDPLMMGLGPIPAIRGLLSRTKLKISDIDAFEINEAFASQAIACQRELEIPVEKLNLSGGAIALGHPLGCTGTRLIATLLNGLERTDGELGIAALCIGHGQGIATLIQRTDRIN